MRIPNLPTTRILTRCTSITIGRQSLKLSLDFQIHMHPCPWFKLKTTHCLSFVLVLFATPPIGFVHVCQSATPSANRGLTVPFCSRWLNVLDLHYLYVHTYAQHVWVWAIVPSSATASRNERLVVHEIWNWLVLYTGVAAPQIAQLRANHFESLSNITFSFHLAMEAQHYAYCSPRPVFKKSTRVLDLGRSWTHDLIKIYVGWGQEILYQY